MSGTMSSRGGNSHGTARKRNLPSWMSSKEDENDGDEKTNQPRSKGKSKEQSPVEVEMKGSLDFSKLMEGVVFVLSGFVNPERGILRSQMLEMGAEYQPDWDSNSTLLVCAFPNTPKFRQVEADDGTIISKDWISQCYNQRKLVDIESYLLNVGKPWRKQHISHETSQDIKIPMPRKSLKQEEKGSKKSIASSKMKSCFSPPKVKKWAVEDLKQTISWLENQDEKPDPHEINNIASEGILTCLQDAIDALKQGQDIQAIAETWACVPRLVKELAELDSATDSKASLSKEDLCREAMVCKQIYELEFLNVQPQSYGNKKAPKDQEKYARDDASYDSDETIEMTEEEIDEAYNSIASTL